MPTESQSWWHDDLRYRMLFSVAGASGIRGMSSYFFAPKLLLGAGGLASLEITAPSLTKNKKALIVTDKYVKNLAEKVLKSLTNGGLQAEIWDEVIPEPPVDNVLAGVEAAERLGVDLFVAVGGGSVMDATKAIWMKYAHPEMDLRQVASINAETLLPTTLNLRSKAYFIAVPTTSGTGSETTATAVITDGGQKKVLNHPELVPDMAILDPAFTVGMPPTLTAYTGMDALAHAIGGVLSHWANEYTLPMGYQAISLVRKYLPRAVANGSDYEARYKMLVASNMAGMAFGNAAPGIDHAMGHAFGKLFKIHHGCAVGIFVPYMMQYVARYSDMYLELARRQEVGGATDREVLDNLVLMYNSFAASVKCPTTIAGLGITRQQFEEKLEILLDYTLADVVHLMCIRPVTRDHYRRLYNCAYSGEKVDF